MLLGALHEGASLLRLTTALWDPAPFLIALLHLVSSEVLATIIAARSYTHFHGNWYPECLNYQYARIYVIGAANSQ